MSLFMLTLFGGFRYGALHGALLLDPQRPRHVDHRGLVEEVVEQGSVSAEVGHQEEAIDLETKKEERRGRGGFFGGGRKRDGLLVYGFYKAS